MARRRMVDPNIWTSEDVGKLNMMQRLLLVGMFSNADDYGKGKANPVFLRSTIFPYDDIPANEIEEALAVIEKYINIVIYTVDGSKYYKFTRWKKWQTVQKPQESVIPEPPKETEKNDSGISQESVENHSGLREEKRREEEEKRREDRKEEKGIEEEEEKENENDSSAASAEFSKLAEIFNKNIHKMSPVESEKIQRYLNDVSYEVIILAIGEAVIYDKKSMGYINAVLDNWIKHEVKTKEDAEAYLRDRKDEKSQGAGQGKKYKNGFNDYDQRTYDIKALERKLLGRDDSEEGDQ